jgi:hypothetical protein
MMYIHFREAPRCGFLMASVLNLVILNLVASAQSPLVFMTLDSSVHRFDYGIQTSTFGPGGGAFHGVTIHNNNVLVADFTGDAIRRISPTGASLGDFASIASPTFLESDRSGNVYTNPSVLGAPVATRFNSSGVVTQTFSHPSMAENAGMDADAAGNVYIAGFTQTTAIFKFAPDGTFINSTPLGALRARDLAIDEAGNRLFLTDTGSPIGIKIFDISGAIPVMTGGIATPLGATIEGVHFAAETGRILATDFGLPSNDPRGFEFSPSGTLLWTYEPTGNLAFDITTHVIPEPMSAGLMFAGAFGWHLLNRRSRRLRCASA